jgi:predicted nucleotidyltransferase
MNLKTAGEIKSIILFGSVAKEEETKQSDIDIFIEVKKENKKLDLEVKNILNEFYESREALIFKNKGIDNKINVITGKLENWPDLKKSIDSTGIIFYGRYIPSGIEGRKNAIIIWDKIGKNRGAFLNKLYGFRIGEIRYKGMIENFDGKKLGKSSIMVPVEYRDEILKIAKKYRVSTKIIEVWV